MSQGQKNLRTDREGESRLWAGGRGALLGPRVVCCSGCCGAARAGPVQRTGARCFYRDQSTCDDNDRSGDTVSGSSGRHISGSGTFSQFIFMEVQTIRRRHV